MSHDGQRENASKRSPLAFSLRVGEVHAACLADKSVLFIRAKSGLFRIHARGSSEPTKKKVLRRERSERFLMLRQQQLIRNVQQSARGAGGGVTVNRFRPTKRMHNQSCFGREALIACMLVISCGTGFERGARLKEVYLTRATQHKAKLAPPHTVPITIT